MIRTEHTIHLAGGQNNIHIRITAGIILVRLRTLGLLGQARHDGNNTDVMRINPLQLGKIALDRSAEHLMRGLGG